MTPSPAETFFGRASVASGAGDERAPAGMRRAPFESEFAEQRRKPIDHARWPQMAAAGGADHRSGRLRGARQSFQRAPQVGMHGNPPSAALLCNDVADMDRAGNVTLRVENHGPIKAGDF